MKRVAVIALAALAVTAAACSSTPAPSYSAVAKEGAVTQVTCTSSTHCLAMGSEAKGIVNRAYVALSDDGGQHFTLAKHPPLTESPTGLACWDATHCLMLSLQISAVTADGGKTWKVIGPVPIRVPISGPVACPAANTCMLVGESSAVPSVPSDAVSSDGGATWTVHPMGSVAIIPASVSCLSAFTCLAVGAGTGATAQAVVAETTDGGLTWTAKPAPTTGPLGSITCVPGSQTCVALSDKGSTAVATDDGGTTWSTTKIALKSPMELAATTCGTTTQCAITTGGDVIATSQDGGKKYSLSQLAQGSLSRDPYCDASTCLVGGSTTQGIGLPGAIERSTNGGHTWHKVWEGV